MKILACDVDRVILNLEKAYVESYKSLYNKKLKIIYPLSFNFSKKFGLTSEENYNTKKNIDFKSLKATEDAEFFLNEANKIFDRILFISSLNHELYEDRCENLYNLFKIDKNNICCLGKSDKGKSLKLFSVDYFIDDYPNNIESALKYGIKNSYFLDHGYNDINSDDLPYKVKSLKEFLCIIRNM